MSMTYDSVGRPATATSAYGAVTTYGYTSAGTVPAQQTKTGPDGFTRTTLDGFGRVILVERGPNSSTIQSYVSKYYTYCACSPLGKIQKTSQPYAPGGSAVWTQYTYDGIGRTLTTVMPDGASTTSYWYLGSTTNVTDPAGNWKQLVTDVSGNLVTVLEPDPANPPSGTLLTGYSYDWMNHVIQTSMTRAGTTQTRSFVYNNAGQLTSATNVENGTVSYTYNSDTTLASKQDAKGQVEVYTYDSKKRVIEVQEYPTGLGGSEDTCQRVTYGYDAGTYGIGRLTSAGYAGCPPSSATYTYAESYSYGAPGGITGKTFAVNTTGWSSPASISMSYTYDSAGRLSTDAPNGSTFTYSYDSMGRPASMTDASSLAWTQNGTYDLAGRRTSLQLFQTFSGGSPVYTTESRSYNVNGQLASLGWSGRGTLTYNYSSSANNGQITQMVDTISGETVSYSYDALKRLTSASSTASWTQTFQYDGFGNLTAKVLNGTTTTIAVTAATNG